MKKIFSLVAIAAVASTMFTSCGDKGGDSSTGPVKAKLTLSAAPAAVAVGAEGEFTVTSNIAAPEAITVTVKSSADATLTVDPASVTIAKGEKTAKGKYKGVADGKATITIAAQGVTMSVPSVEITVGTPPTPNENIMKIITGLSDDDFFWYGYIEDPNDPEPEGSRRNIIYYRFTKVTDDNKPTGKPTGDIATVVYADVANGLDAMGYGEIKQQGAEAGFDGVSLTPVTAGAPITFDGMAKSPKSNWLDIYSPEHKVLATGNELYVAFACGDGNEDGTSAAFRVWAKIKLGADGSWNSFEIIESYVCMNDGEFKVGQKE